MHLILLFVSLTHAADNDALLAPSAADFHALTEAAEAELAVARALEIAVGTTHNDWVQAGASLASCEAAQGGTTARSAVFGRAWRDVVQNLRIKAQDVGTMSVSPTLLPLLTGEDERRRTTLLDNIRDQERALAEAMVWHSRYLAGATSRCGPALVPFEPPSAMTDISVFAWSGPGVLCIDGESANDLQPVVISAGRACMGESDRCRCTAQRVATGGVIGVSTETE